MSNTAIAYKAVGRIQLAVVLQEKTLAFQERVLPENHPDIGTAGWCFECITCFCCLILDPCFNVRCPRRLVA